MKGLEIARKYFEEFGRPMLERDFPELLHLVAAGLCGAGSECFGFDDEISRDHDFEPGFCLFIPGEDAVDRKIAFRLERAYASLPREFEGLKRSLSSPVGGARRGIVRIPDFFRDKTGSETGELTLGEWFSIPSSALAETVNGEIFFDGYGEVTRIRDSLAAYPDGVMRKKLSGSLLIMAQAGQYNYKRCLGHGEEGAAQLAAIEFSRAAMTAVFLLNGVYMPFYKWAFRAMRALPELSLTAELIEYLITTDNGEATREEKGDVIESIAADVIDALIERGLTKATCGDLEKHAYSVNDSIADAELRNMHILAAV